MTNFEKWLQDKDGELFNYYLEGKKVEKEDGKEEDHSDKSGLKTDEDGDGKKGTAKDYLIARFKKGGMPHEEATKKAQEAIDKKKS